MRLVLITCFGLTLMGCNGGPNKTNIEIIQNMMDQISIKSQDWDPQHPTETQMRTPPPGTVAQGKAPYLYAKDPGAAENQVNPYRGQSSAEYISLGQKNYEIYCLVCHGAGGAGDGSVAEKMAVKPRNLITDEAKAYSDGRIFHAIVAGKGVMGAYGSSIMNPEARWAVVDYVRMLQKNVSDKK